MRKKLAGGRKLSRASLHPAYDPSAVRKNRDAFVRNSRKIADIMTTRKAGGTAAIDGRGFLRFKNTSKNTRVPVQKEMPVRNRTNRPAV